MRIFQVKNFKAILESMRLFKDGSIRGDLYSYVVNSVKCEEQFGEIDSKIVPKNTRDPRSKSNKNKVEKSSLVSSIQQSALDSSSQSEGDHEIKNVAENWC